MFNKELSTYPKWVRNPTKCTLRPISKFLEWLIRRGGNKGLSKETVMSEILKKLKRGTMYTGKCFPPKWKVWSVLHCIVQYWQPGHIRMEINKPIPGCSCRAAQLSVWKIGGVLLCVQWQSRDRSGMCPKQTTAILSSVVFRLHFVIKWRFVANTVSYILPAKRSGMVSTLPVDLKSFGSDNKRWTWEDVSCSAFTSR